MGTLTEQATEKVGVVSITLERAEGPISECGASVMVEASETLDAWGEANVKMAGMAISAPKGGGYDKMDFTITFADGGTYSGTYDLKSAERPNLKRHVRDFVQCYAGLMEMPAHMLEGPGSPNIRERQAKENWQNFLDMIERDGTAAQYRDFARKYDVGVEIGEEGR